MIAKKLNRIEALHFEPNEDPQFGQPLAGKYDDSQVLFDTILTSQEYSLQSLLSQHLAVGQHCVEMLQATPQTINTPNEIIHHTSKPRSVAAQRKIGK